MLKKSLLVLAVLFLCSCVKVEAWEKGNFAKPTMAFEPDVLDAKFTQHIYQSREGSSGGYGLAGGGCGCN